MDLCMMVEGQEGAGWADWVALAQRCEQQRIPALFRSDHYRNLDGHLDRGSLDAWATICGLAAATTTLRFGTLVSPVTFRHPAVLARMATTADHISEGRIEVGLGAGWNEPEHRAHGFDFPSLSERIDMLEEQLAVITGQWAQSPFSFAGRHYALEKLQALPQPVQRPRPPIILGGAAGPRAAALAARYADEYNTYSADIDQIRERRSRIAEACMRAGREPIRMSAMVLLITGADDRELRERAERVARTRGLASEAVIANPPPGWLAGRIPEVLEQLAALRELGLSRVMCQTFDHRDLDLIELIATELAPALR